MRQQGAITERKRPARRLAYIDVAKRARGRCELCGVDVERAGARLDPHHAYGRGHLPGIPAAVCETEELILGVCRACHDRIHDGDVELADEARERALSRFVLRHDLQATLSRSIAEGITDPVDAMRELVRRVEQREEAAG